MTMEQVNVLGFWSRFDEVRTGTLEEVARNSGINQGTLRNLRSRKLLPNLLDTVVLADYLNVSLDWLVLGKVDNDENSSLAKLVRAYLEADELSKLVVDRVLKLG